MEKISLDLNQEEFKVLLDKTTNIILKQFDNLESTKAYHSYPQHEVEQWFNEPIPENGMDNETLLDQVEQKIIKTATGNMGPHMYAYVMAGGNQISILAEQLAATINQNGGKWHLAPAINEIEKRVVQWASKSIGFGDNAGGVLVSGGSSANLSGLTVARNIFFEKHNIRKKGLFSQKPFTAYSSVEVHGCVDKSLDLLGIGTDNLKKIKTNPDFTINISALEDQIKQDASNGLQPFCIIGNAGTVNTGAIDNLDALAELAKKYNMWFHIDGAYGGLAAALPALKHRYKGLEKADSIAIDFHKWLYVPFEAGCIIVKNWGILKKAYFKKAAYLDAQIEEDRDMRLDFNKHSFQLSRNSKALKIWMTLKAYGFKRIKQMITKDIDLTNYLAASVEKATDFELKSKPSLGVTCFSYIGNFSKPNDIADINNKLIPALEKDGRVFITGTLLNNEFVLRACLINHRKQKQDIDYLLNVIREVARECISTMKAS